ncbi:Os11g0434800 [Oryza sativa Japonica Group]|uniref:Expressed protein n=2 Tax=Oryza sativa subsp. japonica TaxID=39947 RepID=Q0ISZ9_ORYSJ|nr:expressed protein [Oryza sativa Japonica Group]ABA93140.1 expressed protein [Oryza sativa Japonica Group]BAF28166.1 Os11g0434800 [Oryza sativa Japonica Group]|eukprot:NP_001067803.1 Os11g0434800 [Oryza sativa Japonica Group]
MGSVGGGLPRAGTRGSGREATAAVAAAATAAGEAVVARRRDGGGGPAAGREAAAPYLHWIWREGMRRRLDGRRRWCPGGGRSGSGGALL